MSGNIIALPALNTAAPDPRTHAERFNAVLRNLYNKILPVGAANTILTSDGTTFSWAAPAAIANTGATTFLAGDVAMNNNANFFDGPNTGSIGAAGWVVLLMAVANVKDTASNANFEAGIFNGSAYVANTGGSMQGASFQVTIPLVAVVTLSAATTFTLRARDQTTNSGVFMTTGVASGVSNKATSITWVRLA